MQEKKVISWEVRVIVKRVVIADCSGYKKMEKRDMDLAVRFFVVIRPFWQQVEAFQTALSEAVWR